MKFTTALLTGVLATAAAACSPDLRPYEITNLVQTSKDWEGTTWSFTVTQKENLDPTPFTCKGFLPASHKNLLVDGTCDRPGFVWTPSGYNPNKPSLWSLMLRQTVECPTPKPPQITFITTTLEKDLICNEKWEPEGGYWHTWSVCSADHAIDAPYQQPLLGGQ